MKKRNEKQSHKVSSTPAKDIQNVVENHADEDTENTQVNKKKKPNSKQKEEAKEEIMQDTTSEEVINTAQ